MSSRESLREFQLRLAHRLAAADGASAAWLAVRAGSRPLLLPLSQAGEILVSPVMTPVPYTVAWFLGVAHARGVLYGVVDLGAFLDAESHASGSGAGSASTIDAASVAASPKYATVSAQSGKCKYLSLHPDLGVPCVLRVDALLGLRGEDVLGAVEEGDNATEKATENTIGDAPTIVPAFFARRWKDGAGVVWHEMDLRALAASVQFLDIARRTEKGE